MNMQETKYYFFLKMTWYSKRISQDKDYTYMYSYKHYQIYNMHVISDTSGEIKYIMYMISYNPTNLHSLK